MRALLPFLITGIVTGSLYGLAGVGLVLTYRTSGVFNFGHGALAAGAAFVFYSLHFEHGVPWPLAAIVTVLGFGLVVGWALERITRGLGDVPEAIVIVLTVGILLGVEGYLYLQFGEATRGFPDFLPTSGFTISEVHVSWAQTISVLVSAGSAVLLYAYLRRARLGVAMRAVVDNPTLVSLSGDDPVQVRRAAWAIGAAFAALSGILLAPTLGLDANLLTFLVVQAFGACAIGLFGNLPLTYAGGIIVGVAASVSTKYFTTPPFNGAPPAMPFLILVVVLLVVPSDRFPKRRDSFRVVSATTGSRSPIVTTSTVAACLVALLVVPLVVGSHLPLWTAALTNAVIFSSLALLVWTSGQISLGHASFVAVGACAMGHLTSGFHLPWGVALVLSGLITLPVGAIVAVPAIRLSGLYLALATLGFGVLMQQVVFPTFLMFGRGLSVHAPRPVLGPLNAAHDRQLYYVVLLVAVACVGTIAAVGRGRLGRLLRAMSETPAMLSTHGLGVNVTRLIVFCASAFFAGIAGGLLVTQFGSASGSAFGPLQSLVYLAVLAICGTRLIRAAVLAAALLVVVPGYVTSFGTSDQLFGFGVVAVAAGLIIANRDGLAAMLHAPPARPRATALPQRPRRHVPPRPPGRLQRFSAVPRRLPRLGG